MKKGTGDDPFAEEEDGDDSGDNEIQPEYEDPDTTPTEPSPESTELQSREKGGDLPYLARRQLKNKSVKADRDQVPFFLRSTVQEGERDLRRDVERILGQEVGKTDLREAAYVYAQRNPEGVAEILREWGVEYLD